MLKTTRNIAIAWTCYALLWMAMITGERWIPDDSGVLAVASFGVALVVILLLTTAATITGLLHFRSPSGRTWWFRSIVLLSCVGLFGQLAYAYAFW